MKDMSKSIVLITGAGSGIGREIAKKFVDAGSKTIIIGRRVDQLEGTKEICDPKKQNNIFIQQCDITQETDLDNLISFLKSEFGKIDVLVNNAGASSAVRTISYVTEEMWDNVFDLNVKAVYQLTQKLIPLMSVNKSGTIITISSMAALSPGLLGGAPYGAAKAGVTNLMGHINSELNSKGIRATAIMPAEVDTAAAIVKKCRENGLYLRDISGMGSGVGNRALRMAVKSGETNQHMMKILENVINQ